MDNGKRHWPGLDGPVPHRIGVGLGVAIMLGGVWLIHDIIRPHKTWGFDNVSVCALAFSPDGSLLAGTADVAYGAPLSHDLYVWAVKTGKLRYAVKGGVHVDSVAFSPDGTLLATQDQLRRALAGKLVRTLASSINDASYASHSCQPLVFAPDNETIAGAFEEDHLQIKVWDAATGRVRCTLGGSHNKVLALAFGSHGRELIDAVTDADTHQEQSASRTPSTSGLCNVELESWDTHTGLWKRTVRGFCPLVRSAILSSNGKVLAVVTERWRVELYDATTGGFQRAMTLGVAHGWSPEGAVLALTADGKTLALAYSAKPHNADSRATLEIRDVRTGQLKTVVRRDTRLACCDGEGTEPATFSSDGQHIAFPSRRGLVTVRDALTGAEIHPFDDPAPVSARSNN